MLSHQLKWHVIDGEKAVIQNPSETHKFVYFWVGEGVSCFMGEIDCYYFFFSMKVTVLINNPPVLGMLSLCCNITWILRWYIKCGLSSVLEFCILQIPPLCSQHHKNYLEKFCYIYAFICDWNGISSRS